MSRLPIRVRLTLAFAVAMAVVLSALGAFLYVRLQATLDESIAEGLEARVDELAAAFKGTFAPGATLRFGFADPGERFVQVLEATGELAAGTRGIEREPLVDPATVDRAIEQGGLGLEVDVPTVGARARVQLEPIGTLAGQRVLLVGASLEDRDETLGRFLVLLLVVLPVALLVSSALGYLVAGAALRPMEEMRREAAEISSTSSKRRLPVPGADDEVRRLGATLNEMLGRLDAGLERERQFVADASHELRTPLAILKTELELALRQPRSAQELEDALGSALEETERLARLAEDLLLVARADQDVLDVQPARVRVDELLERVAQRYRGTADGRAIEVDCGPLQIDADHGRLEQAVGNLVDNALRHGAGTVTVLAVECEGSTELHVTDEGGGLDPTFVPVAFERFSRADGARASAGTGIGLAIVSAIARAHGGSVGVRNRHTGGADVWLAVPSRLNSEHALRGDRIGVD